MDDVGRDLGDDPTQGAHLGWNGRAGRTPGLPLEVARAVSRHLLVKPAVNGTRHGHFPASGPLRRDEIGDHPGNTLGRWLADVKHRRGQPGHANQ